MEIFDLIFWTIGRGVQKICKATGFVKFDLSDGGHWALGFFTTFVMCLLAFIIWGVLNV